MLFIGRLCVRRCLSEGPVAFLAAWLWQVAVSLGFGFLLRSKLGLAAEGGGEMLCWVSLGSNVFTVHSWNLLCVLALFVPVTEISED